MMSTFPRPRLAAAFAALTLLTAGSPARAGDPAEAAALLKAASAARRLSHNTEGAEKARLLGDAVVAYRRVLDEQADQAPACAEAAFRIGEIHRTLREVGPARAAFTQALGLGGASPEFAARAALELGHLDRRAGAADDALRRYRQVLDDFPARSREGAQAITWIGKVEEARGDGARARETWLSLADRLPSEAVRAVRAADLAALSAIREGRRDEARDILARTRARFSADNPEQEYWSPEVDRAIERMKSPAALGEGTDGAGSSEPDDDGGV